MTNQFEQGKAAPHNNSDLKSETQRKLESLKSSANFDLMPDEMVMRVDTGYQFLLKEEKDKRRQLRGQLEFLLPYTKAFPRLLGEVQREYMNLYSSKVPAQSTEAFLKQNFKVINAALLSKVSADDAEMYEAQAKQVLIDFALDVGGTLLTAGVGTVAIRAGLGMIKYNAVLSKMSVATLVGLRSVPGIASKLDVALRAYPKLTMFLGGGIIAGAVIQDPIQIAQLANQLHSQNQVVD